MGQSGVIDRLKKTWFKDKSLCKTDMFTPPNIAETIFAFAVLSVGTTVAVIFVVAEKTKVVVAEKTKAHNGQTTSNPTSPYTDRNWVTDRNWAQKETGSKTDPTSYYSDLIAREGMFRETS